MRHQLIIIDGHSTVGKSTISKSVYQQLVNQDQACWLHEECEKHPIREGEFEAGDINSLDGMELNRQLMLDKWRRLTEIIRQSGQVFVMEGCLLHSVDRYLLQSVWDAEQIMNYFGQILEIIQPLNPLIVFLHRPDLKASFEKAFKARGERWRDLILGLPLPSGYLKAHPHAEEDDGVSIFEGLLYEQEQMEQTFAQLSCAKLKVDTTEEQWEQYIREITEAAGYQFRREEPALPQIEKYCGAYRIQDGKGLWKIGFDDSAKCFYTSLFWPYMPMKYIGDDQFELISFPVTLKFDFTGAGSQFTVAGNYDWDCNGKTFIKVPNAEVK
ncbi:MAG TPA: hypothetical protein DHD79_12440 [Firmicutes bacterium]|mgnify:CR=1 FL=1|jgi:hypothetical protein|nr:hypothetical protein [Bacillota bacterium]HAZ21615.1 hypothetical protein [Bacillota bacterium]HBE05020.1 hypothetical protein [Bacillota bacterium]HBG45315.1 hypothetical protein [Bacillota bacterium]HBL50933.1 hypothetical protein [Bacillota bacterium]